MTLAQDIKFEDIGPLLGWLGVLIVCLIIVTLGFKMISRRMLHADHRTHSASMMEDLRQVRRDGRMSDEEYQTIRARLIERTRGERPEGPSNGADR